MIRFNKHKVTKNNRKKQLFIAIFLIKSRKSYFISHLPPISHHLKSYLFKGTLRHRWQYGRLFHKNSNMKK